MSDRITSVYSDDILNRADVKIETRIEFKYWAEYCDLFNKYEECDSQLCSSIQLSDEETKVLKERRNMICKHLAQLELSKPIQSILKRAEVGELDVELIFVKRSKLIQEDSDNNDNKNTAFSPWVILAIILLLIITIWIAIIYVSK